MKVGEGGREEEMKIYGIYRSYIQVLLFVFSSKSQKLSHCEIVHLLVPFDAASRENSIRTGQSQLKMRFFNFILN